MASFIVKYVASYTYGAKSFSASVTMGPLSMLSNYSWNYGSCYRYSDQSYGLGIVPSYETSSYFLKIWIISLSNSLMLDLPLSVSFLVWSFFSLLFGRLLFHFFPISSIKLALILWEKAQAT